MNKTAKIILGIVIAIIVVVGAYFGVKYFFNTQEASNNNTNINNTNGNMALVENNTVENNIIENNTATENNIVEDNTAKNEDNNEIKNETKVTEENKNKVSSNNDSEIESDSDEEKALAIVKKDWGSTDGVYFKVQAIDANGNYVISVNNADTTQVMEWYTVNPKTGEFSN